MLKVRLSNKTQKQLRKVPKHIAQKFAYWCDLLQFVGLREARKYQGYHDEPLQGARFGQRSVRLSRSYRAIYRDLSSGQRDLIEVLEVNKHEY